MVTRYFKENPKLKNCFDTPPRLEKLQMKDVLKDITDL